MIGVPHRLCPPPAAAGSYVRAGHEHDVWLRAVDLAIFRACHLARDRAQPLAVFRAASGGVEVCSRQACNARSGD